MKRALTITLVLLFSAIFSLSAKAESEAEFYITGAEGTQGDEVKVEVCIDNNPGIISFKLLVDYDEDALAIVNAEEKDLSDIAFGPMKNVPFSMLWCDAIHDDNTSDGTIAVLTFRIKGNTKPGDYSISLSYDEEDVFDTGFNNVNFQTKSGVITVSGENYFDDNYDYDNIDQDLIDEPDYDTYDEKRESDTANQRQENAAADESTSQDSTSKAIEAEEDEQVNNNNSDFASDTVSGADSDSDSGADSQNDSMKVYNSRAGVVVGIPFVGIAVSVALIIFFKRNRR